MKYLLPVLEGLLLTVLTLLCPFIVLLVLPLIKWDSSPTPDQGPSDGYSVIRGNLPSWLSWLETPDERLPGGMYEPTVRSVYEKYGKYVCSWYWLGTRNAAMTLAVRMGKPATSFGPDQSVMGLWEDGDIWRYVAQLGPLRFVAGYQVYKLLDGTLRAAPVLSIKVRTS